MTDIRGKLSKLVDDKKIGGDVEKVDGGLSLQSGTGVGEIGGDGV